MAQNMLIRTLGSLGFYISWTNLTSPTQCCRFLAINIDSLKLILSHNKMKRIHAELAFWSNRTISTKIQMQRLSGI